MILKFHKKLKYSKTNHVKPMIFSGHLEMIISQLNFDFEWHGIDSFLQKMLAMNPIYCVSKWPLWAAVYDNLVSFCGGCIEAAEVFYIPRDTQYP